MKTFFVFDDHSIPFRSNLDLTLLPGVKYGGNPVLRRGAPGSPDARWARLWGGTVLRDEGKFRMWYSGADSVESWMKCEFRALYAESEDGLNWTKHGPPSPFSMSETPGSGIPAGWTPRR